MAAKQSWPAEEPQLGADQVKSTEMSAELAPKKP